MRPFGPFLANLRSTAGLSLEELARLVDTSRSTISRLENNEVSQPFRGTIRKVVISLAEILCTSRIETERYLKHANIDQSLLTEIEEIQLGFVPHIVKGSPAEVSDLTRLAQTYTQLLHNLQTRQAELGSGKAPHLAVKIQEYTQALHDMQKRLSDISQKQTQPQQENAQEQPPEPTQRREGKPIAGYQIDDSFVPLENGIFVPVSLFSSAPSTKEVPADSGTHLSEALSRIFAQIHLWQAHHWPCQALHRLLDMEMHMFDEMNPQSDPEEHRVSRRNALLALATLPVSLLEVMRSHQQSASPEELLPVCTASITACWHLMAGREFEAIERAVTAYLPHLIRWAQQSSPHRPTALHLAAQGYLLMGIIALHKLAMPTSFQARLAYCQQAVESARGSEDRTLLIMALAHVATAYYDMGQPTGVQAYQEAESLLTEQTAPLLRSRVFASAARVYARFGQVQEALYRIGEARAIYPSIVADAPSFVTADSGLVPMILQEGLAYLALGHHEPTKDYYTMAEKALTQIERVPSTVVVPERFLIWVVNEQAFTAIKVKNLDDFERYFIQGMQGANILGSQKRRQEAIANWKEARKVWPNEKRVTELADLFV
ncbi:MAG: helix-turn-helix domain-containing protein [Ktedonobacteraceae bacterium]|nr:helix-turn-helix domain-containing protein [Ktedonobacteraceae bacterium]